MAAGPAVSGGARAGRPWCADAAPTSNVVVRPPEAMTGPVPASTELAEPPVVPTSSSPLSSSGAVHRLWLTRRASVRTLARCLARRGLSLLWGLARPPPDSCPSPRDSCPQRGSVACSGDDGGAQAFPQPAGRAPARWPAAGAPPVTALAATLLKAGRPAGTGQGGSRSHLPTAAPPERRTALCPIASSRTCAPLACPTRAWPGRRRHRHRPQRPARPQVPQQPGTRQGAASQGTDGRLPSYR